MYLKTAANTAYIGSFVIIIQVMTFNKTLQNIERLEWKS